MDKNTMMQELFQRMFGAGGFDINQAVQDTQGAKTDQMAMLANAFGQRPQMNRRDISGNYVAPGGPRGLDLWYANNPNARPGEFDPSGALAAQRGAKQRAVEDQGVANTYKQGQVQGGFLNEMSKMLQGNGEKAPMSQTERDRLVAQSEVQQMQREQPNTAAPPSVGLFDTQERGQRNVLGPLLGPALPPPSAPKSPPSAPQSNTAASTGLMNVLAEVPSAAQEVGKEVWDAVRPGAGFAARTPLGPVAGQMLDALTPSQQTADKAMSVISPLLRQPVPNYLNPIGPAGQLGMSLMRRLASAFAQ